MSRTTLTVGLFLSAGALVLSGCSSSAESEVTPTVTPTPSETVEPVAVLAEDACSEYFAVDLLRAEMNGDTSAMKKKEKQTLLADMQLTVDQMVVAIDAAVIGGELPAKALANAERIQNNVNKANPKQGIEGFTKKQRNRINSSAERIELLCVAAGNDLPIANIDARSN
ncbi:MAG: hypothetical protein K9G12_00050 [Candidatus Nanopelagicales bacterium]|nr:hypothetical protein [Candidatus Nanopelagicales bacterium]